MKIVSKEFRQKTACMMLCVFCAQFLLPFFLPQNYMIYAAQDEDTGEVGTSAEDTSDHQPAAEGSDPSRTDSVEEDHEADTVQNAGEETDEEADDENRQEEEQQRSESIMTNAIPGWPQGPAVSAKGAILIEADTGTILYGKNIHEKLYPASTTKILTTLIAAERCELNETVKFSAEAVNSIERASSNMGIDIGQELTMEQCLYGILVYSANEVANAVAEHVSGSIDAFVELMNERAAELGATDSHFVTTNGLHDDAHYTTPYDLAQIGRAFFCQ